MQKLVFNLTDTKTSWKTWMVPETFKDRRNGLQRGLRCQNWPHLDWHLNPENLGECPKHPPTDVMELWIRKGS